LPCLYEVIKEKPRKDKKNYVGYFCDIKEEIKKLKDII
jgi:hypothetical protein